MTAYLSRDLVNTQPRNTTSPSTEKRTASPSTKEIPEAFTVNFNVPGDPVRLVV